MSQSTRQAFIATIPVMTGYLALGFGFGIMLKASGFPVWLAPVMSITMYAGAMQYVAVGLLSSGTDLFTVGLTTILVNARHLFYGISMLDKFKGTGKRTPYMIFALTDETYSLLCREVPHVPLTERKHYYFCICFFNHCYWIVGCTLGAVTTVRESTSCSLLCSSPFSSSSGKAQRNTTRPSWAQLSPLYV